MLAGEITLTGPMVPTPRTFTARQLRPSNLAANGTSFRLSMEPMTWAPNTHTFAALSTSADARKSFRVMTRLGSRPNCQRFPVSRRYVPARVNAHTFRLDDAPIASSNCPRKPDARAGGTAARDQARPFQCPTTALTGFPSFWIVPMTHASAGPTASMPVSAMDRPGARPGAENTLARRQAPAPVRAWRTAGDS